jgi:hypothetical protein
MPIICLTKEEMMEAVHWGGRRRLEHIFDIDGALSNFVGNPNWNGWNADIEGVAAEMAYCKYRGIEWRPTTFHEADVGDNVQIRHTERDDGSLIFKPRDKKLSDHWFVLVTGKDGRYDVAGYMKGRDCMRDEWLRSPYGEKSTAWFAPKTALCKFPGDRMAASG